MIRFYFLWLIVLSASLTSLPSPANAQELLVQGDLWCPYTCEPGGAEPGYVIEIMQTVFEHSGVKFKYETVPWSRTLLQTRDGRASIAVVATQQEAEQYGLLTGPTPVGNSSDCLYVAASNNLTYSGVDDLRTLKAIGVAAGYTYSDDVDAWLKRRENKNRIQVQTGDSPAERNAKNLALGRLDGVIEDEQVMQHMLAKLALQNKLRLAGCGKQTPVFVAFSPKLKNAQELISLFDAGLAELRQNKQLAKILAKYGLSDWK